MNHYNYIIITPAKNEEKFIEKTMQSVISQKVLPMRWVIVDDGSTDRTADIVKNYLKEYTFIQLVQREQNIERNFGNKVYAIRRGFEEVKDLDYEFYCNLDADVSFEPDYFEFLLKKFNDNPKLGVCGGKVYDLINGKFIPQKYENHSVAGPIQFFRRECYESFGGYPISEIGFIDGFAEISARFNGWETQTFTDKIVYHHRPMGTFRGNSLKRHFQSGQIEYLFGYYYPYHILRNLPRIFIKPYFVGYITILLGYLKSLLSKKKRFVSKSLMRYIHKEQKQRILGYFRTKKYL